MGGGGAGVNGAKGAAAGSQHFYREGQQEGNRAQVQLHVRGMEEPAWVRRRNPEGISVRLKQHRHFLIYFLSLLILYQGHWRCWKKHPR